MQNLIDQYLRYPSVENARLLRDYFERHPSRVWVLRDDSLRVLAKACGQLGYASRRLEAATAENHIEMLN